MEEISINEFLENPVENSDKFFNFYDWFCKDSTLEKRMLSLVPKLKFLVKEGIIDGESNYVWFKNNCPCDGSVYDDIRISTLDKENTFLGGFCPKTGHNNIEEKCSVWWFKEGELVTKNFKNWNTFKKEVKTNPEFKAELVKAYKI